MKDLQYITHDLGARNDPKLLKLQMEMGGQGLAIFWCLVEMLWENDGYLPTDYDALAFNLRWATAQEVERVVTMYGLFIHDDNERLFWSQSALERIAQKKQRLSVREASARNAANVRWGRAGNAPGMPAECATHAEAMPIEKYRNIDKKKDSNNAPLTAADFFEIFFFDNVKDPLGEAQRFLDHYIMTFWTYTDGTPVTDVDRAAHDWKPKTPGKRFPAEALNWYRAIWQAYKGTVSNVEQARKTFLYSLDALRLQGQKLAMAFKTREAALAVAEFIKEHDLAGDWQLDFRVSN